MHSFPYLVILNVFLFSTVISAIVLTKVFDFKIFSILLIPKMKCHQILTGACNAGDKCFAAGSVEGVSFTVSFV